MKSDDPEDKAVSSTVYTMTIAGVEIPAHLAWQKLEVLNTGADLLERLNREFPELATEFSRGVIPRVRARLKTALEALPEKMDHDADLAAFVQEQLKVCSPEEVADKLQEEFGVECDLPGLIYIGGPDAYLESMKREALLYKQNAISPDQTAELWNDLDRPAPGKPHWNGKDVQELLDH